jgi:hypothetical protein
MKKTGFVYALLLVIIVSASQAVQAQDYKFAAGIRFSSHDAVVNNSISVKYFTSPGVALEGLLSFGDPLAVGVLLEKHNNIGTPGLTWLYGAGVFAAFGGDRYFGPQGIVGLDYKFQNIPLNLSLDWKPELSIIKKFSFEPAAVAISARFAFQ